MRPFFLLLVLLFAKALILLERDLPWSGVALLAYVWQDLWLVVLYAVLDWTIFRPWLSVTAYGVLVFYTAINVPIVHVLSTPMTAPMLRAASGTLSASISHYVTLPNVLQCFAVIGFAIGLPYLLRKQQITVRTKTIAALVMMSLALCGQAISSQINTRGMHRNALVVLAISAIPRITGAARVDNWERSPFGAEETQDMTWLRGLAKGRNVIIVHLESTAAGYLRPYGADEDPMPNLTTLARTAIIGESAYTVFPETIKSLVAVQSSIYSALDVEAERYEYLQSPSLASELSRAGYRTGLFHSGRFRYLGMEAVIRNRGYDTLEDAGTIGGNHESSFGIDEESTLKRMLAWIDDQPLGRLFYISYMPIAGHHPYNTPTVGPFEESELIGRYRNALHYSDRILGEFLDGLRARSLLENALIIIVGDHGEAFEQHQGNIGHSLLLYDENVRIPYLIVAPGLIQQTIRIRRVISLVDTAPTILDLLGMARPTAYQGRSMLEPLHRMALFCTDYSQGLLGLRDNQWKFIHNLDTNRSELFDLHRDPNEQHDLATEHPQRVDVYRRHLLRWSENQKNLVGH